MSPLSTYFSTPPVIVKVFPEPVCRIITPPIHNTITAVITETIFIDDRTRENNHADLRYIALTEQLA